MYNAHWIHSLPYSKFIELTLFRTRKLFKIMKNWRFTYKYDKEHVHHLRTKLFLQLLVEHFPEISGKQTLRICYFARDVKCKLKLHSKIIKYIINEIFCFQEVIAHEL